LVHRADWISYVKDSLQLKGAVETFKDNHTSKEANEMDRF